MRRTLVPIAFLATLGLAAAHFASSVRPAAGNGWKVVAWNDLGMHCMDSDYGVFSILPPFNVVHAQVMGPGGTLQASDANLALTFEGVADPSGSINSTSAGKTNYWQHATELYGASSTPDTGLLGFDMPGPGNVPQAMGFDATVPEWAAPGIPITPYDDDGHKRPYPLLAVVARDGAGQWLGSATPVVPVSDEMDCRACHASGSADDAMPADGWVFDRNAERDYRLNILRRHDDSHVGDPLYSSALASASYSAAGLYDTVQRMRKPILCARCHASNALPGTGYAGISALTSAVHAFHASVLDPDSGLPLESSANRASCYRCHPGSETRCLRGAMGAAVASDGSLAMQCQSCHGAMSKVGDSARVGWLDQPNCQACHTGTAISNNGQIRYTDVFEPDGSLRQAVDPTFATNADAPAPGFSLYRFSSGHGGLRCEACHGSTHAEYPAVHDNDNVQNFAFQGHEGVLVECAKCHDSQPVTVNGGPHGLHPLGQTWVDDHPDVVEQTGSDQCKTCHGDDYRGTVLSRMHADRTLTFEDDTLAFFRGSQVGCYACHDGPDDESPNPNLAPVASDAFAACVDQPVATSLAASDADGDPLALRIVQQPRYGRVGLSGALATYFPDPGFAGVDTYTFAAWDGSIDSNLATVSVTRGATWSNYGAGYPGTLDVVPAFTLRANPVLGSTLTFDVQNTSGLDSVMLLFLSTETAAVETRNGGEILTEIALLVMVPLQGSGAALDVDVPNDPALTGLSFFVQSLQADRGARYHIAFSRGLRFTLGS